MLAIISAALQIIFIFIQNKFERDKEEKARKEALYAESKTAIASRDLSAINSVMDKLRS